MNKKTTTIRLTEQDKAAIAAIREQYGLSSDSEAIRFALHTMWRELRLEASRVSSLDKKSINSTHSP